MATGLPVTDYSGAPLQLVPQSICVHGDTRGAVEIARAVRTALEAADVLVATCFP